ncbi:MAG: isocyanide synthase family protein [Mycobacteriaceae bacterium]|nr:isocyanide synthase family protein [Mycobacteriaceae bacterium]
MIDAARKNPMGLPYDVAALKNTIKQIIGAGSTLRLVLPAFHGKSPLRAWTVSNLPDYGDVLAARTLLELRGRIADIYPDTWLFLISEGHLYGDVELLGDDIAVNAYLDKVRAMFAGCDGVSVVDVSELLPSGSCQQQRQAFLDCYCPTVAQMRQMFVEPRYLELYKSYIKLNQRLLGSAASCKSFRGAAVNETMSRSARDRRGKELAILQLRKYVGFAKLIIHSYGPEPYVKLSPLYKEPGDVGIGINLIAGNHQRATPSFFSMCQDAQGSYRFIKAASAREAGCILVERDGLPLFVAPARQCCPRGDISDQ